jgi:thiol-disulfide isomerase/thioredoxin
MNIAYLNLFIWLISINTVFFKSKANYSSPITVTTIDNKTYSLGSNSEYIYVVNFWFIGCAPCRKEIPQLNELVASYSRRQKIKFIAISVSDNEDALRLFKKRVRFDFQFVAEGRDIAHRMGVDLFPTNLIIDQRGKIVFRHNGYSANIQNDIRSVVNSLL